MFSSFGNRILVSGETAGLKFENDHFSDVSAPEKFSPKLRNGRVPVREVTIFYVSEQGKAYFRLRRNGRLIVRKITILSVVWAPEKILPK